MPDGPLRGPSAVVFAYHGFGVEGLDALARQGVAIRRVFSHADSPGERVWWRSVAGWCGERGIPCELDADLVDPAAVGRIAAADPDFLFSFYYRRMIPEVVLALGRRGAFNLHGSLLPRFRGRSPVNWQLVHGVRESGLTLHRMVRKADAGELVGQVAVPVHPDQDALGLTRQLLAVAPTFLDGAIGALVAGTAVPVVQDHAAATYFGGRKPADGLIDWQRPARAIHDLVRAVAPPWPGAFTVLAGRRLLLWRTAVTADDGSRGAPGLVLADGTIACGAGALAVLAAGWEDESPVALRPGDHLMPPCP